MRIESPNGDDVEKENVFIANLTIVGPIKNGIKANKTSSFEELSWSVREMVRSLVG